MRETHTFSMTDLSVPLARRFVARTIVGLPEDVVETAVLLVSELATNSLVHARSDFEVAVTYPAPSGNLRVEVSDGDQSRPAPQNPPPTAPHGRGLQIVESLAGSWGIVEAAGGKTVWFELAVPSSIAAPIVEEARPKARPARPGDGRSPLVRVRLPRLAWGWGGLRFS